MRRLKTTGWDEIKVDKVKKTLRKAMKWKWPGIYIAHNFWLNTLDSVHENMNYYFNRAITNPVTNPQ